VSVFEIHRHFDPAALVADAGGDHLSGCMIALMPTEADAQRLAVAGGESAAELHCTLWYLGDDAAIWSDDQRNELEADIRAMVLGAEFGSANVLKANIFGAAHWNGDGEKPSWVWSVGDAPGDDPVDGDDDGLQDVRELVTYALENRHGPDELPTQHTPWVAHICAAYSDDPSFLEPMEERLGPVTFDRIRLSFGDDDRDIPLNVDQVLTAAGPMRRNPKEFERLSTVDFALMDASWKAAVDKVYAAWMSVLSGQRQELYDQIKAAVDGRRLGDLAKLTVSTEHAVDVLTDQMTVFAKSCGLQQQHEADRQGVHVGSWSLTDDSLTAAGLVRWRDRITSFARVTASALASRLSSSASRRSVVLGQAHGRGSEVARQVDTDLSGHPQDYVRQDLAAAMTAAQNYGRMAVLTAAPPGRYYASEMLDKRTCKPCRAIDGNQFTGLDAADAAYPAGGYVDCSGGTSCRGTLVTVWDEGEVASAAPEGGAAVSGTKKDKRLKENPDAAAAGTEHFGPASGPVSTKPWDGAASRFNDAQYERAAAACDPGEGTVKERCFLPHHEPDGSVSKAGVHAAAQRASALSGHDPAAVARAKAHLRSHYGQLGEDVPDSIKATLGDAVELALAPVESVENFDAPSTIAPWRGPLAVEGKVTGDGREFSADSLTWRDLPLPLRWNKEDSHGGEPHTVAVNVGRIDKIWREGDLIMGEGVLDLSTEDGTTVFNKISGQFLRGVSVDADSIKDSDVEVIMPDVSGTDAEDDPLMALFAMPEKVIYHAGRISAATLCDIPAFAEAYIALLDSEGAVTAGGVPIGEGYLRKGEHRRTIDGLVAGGPLDGTDWMPPADWFTDPKLSLPTGITVTDDGRVYGHAATWGTCHIGQADVCVQPPREENHPYYMTGEVKTKDGNRVSVGQITVGTGHAPLNVGAVPATEHYDHTGHAVADVTVGNDEHGIWVAGAIRPGADPELVHALRAAGQVSGDWRRIGSQLRLVGLLAVNVPGFPVPKMATRITASGAEGTNIQMALVAAGRPAVSHALSDEETTQAAFRVVMDALFHRIHRGDA
jgi:hypothetical protein